jgi:RimJ/RimL family protein N-acetyltransferase
MGRPQDYQKILKNRQEQMLKLVAKSFYKELVNYGIDTSDIVTVSMHLLDQITEKDETTSEGNGYYNKLFIIQDVQNLWNREKKLQLENVSISFLHPEQVPTVCQWLKNNQIKRTFIDLLPKSRYELTQYFFEDPTRKYFGIYYQEVLVGIIGAENIDHQSKKLEMKKFVGEAGYSGKGIGKRATFLFLFYVFYILKFNKVYIHSMDTNIRNINLNSKFGFELEGIFFQEIFKENQYYDVVRMGLLKEHWEEIFARKEK